MPQIGIIQHFGKYEKQLPLPDMIKDFISNQYDYAVIINNRNEIEGFFTNKMLLEYTYKLGFNKVNSYDSLISFSNTLNTNFTILKEIPTNLQFYKDETELYFIHLADEVIGLIDRVEFLKYYSKKMQLEKHHFDTVFNAVPSGIMSVNIEGHITMMNPAAEKISGVTKKMAIGNFITDVVPPKGLLKVLQTGKGHVEKYKVGKRWYVSHREPIYDGKQLVGAVGVFDDISKTEALSTELQTIKRLAKENETLLSNSLDGVAIIDGKGVILQQNALFQEMNLAILYDKQQHFKLFKLLQESLRTNSPHVYEEYIHNIKANYRISYNPINGAEEQKASQIFVRIQDITEQMKVRKRSTILQQMNDHLLRLNSFDSFIHSSDEMKAINNKVNKIIKVNAPVLIEGAIGTGRSTLARQIILRSERKNAPFLEIDCFGKSFTELKNLLFSSESKQQLRTLSGGTIYFKNIDCLPLPLQNRLASLLSYQTINNLQDLNEKGMDIRLISSVSNNISFTGDIRFSEQLYYLLNAFTIKLPSLASRLEDTIIILKQFVDVLNEKYSTETKITEKALLFISQTKWRTNLLEMKVFLEKVMIIFPNQVIDTDLLKDYLPDLDRKLEKPIVVNQIIPLKQAKELLETEIIELLRKQNISYRKMAKILEVNPSTIIRKVKNK